MSLLPVESTGRGSKVTDNETTTPNSEKNAPIIKDISIQLLLGGFVGSFNDFMSFVQQKLPSIQKNVDLSTFRNLLTACEEANRLGNAEIIYHTKYALAEFYQGLDCREDVIVYLTEALHAGTQLESSRELEIQAGYELGLAYEAIGSHGESAKYFEKSRQLSIKTGNTKYDDLNTISLVRNKLELAELISEKEAAIEIYNRCLEICNQSRLQDSDVVVDIRTRLCNLYKPSNLSIATQFMLDVIEQSKMARNPTNQARANLELSSCYEYHGNYKLAAMYLQEFSNLTEGNPEMKASHAKGNLKLGILYGKLGDHSLAIESFERYYQATIQESANSQGTVLELDLDLAKMHLGISRANAKMKPLFSLVTDQSMSKLLTFKRDGYPAIAEV